MALCHLSTLPHLVIMWIFLEQCYKIIPILRSSELTERNSELECRNLLYFQMSSFPQGPIWNWYIFINDMDSETEFPNSASLQMTPKWVEQFICLKEEMLYRGTLKSLRSEHRWTSWGSTRSSARSCTWVRTTTSINTGWMDW